MIAPSVRTRLYDLFDKPVEKLFVNRTGATLAEGDIVAVDITGSDQSKTAAAFVPGTDADTVHPFANVISAATNHLKGWIFAVAAESIADDATGKFYLRGVVKVKLAASGTSNVTAGARFTATNGQVYASLLADGNQCLGQAIEASAASAATKLCIFDGYCYPGGGGTAN